ncbi:MAG TPA: peptide chain release factor N(5)-glutamine methyltransferase [Armatimonadetes bacterium]|nr:peptide chain release factor N(5)-glutamine methyltransferase [Armatimonadota bacterium]
MNVKPPTVATFSPEESTRKGSVPTEKEVPRTVLAALEWAEAKLAAHGVDNPQVNAELLLRHFLRLRRPELYLHPERPLTQEQVATLATAVARRCQREPLAYITGTQEFMGLELKVDGRALVPRFDTEVLVEQLLERLSRRRGRVLVADIGTGCGAIAVSLAVYLPHCVVYATDISPGALSLAAENARRFRVSRRVKLLSGDLFEPLRRMGLQGRLSAIAANLPYVPSDLIPTLQPEVSRYEPRLALDGGIDGLDFIRRIAAEAHLFLQPDGFVACEFAAYQAELVREIFTLSPVLRISEIVKDYNGLERVAIADRRGWGMVEGVYELEEV